jgi:hypothetical protein
MHCDPRQTPGLHFSPLSTPDNQLKRAKAINPGYII